MNSQMCLRFHRKILVQRHVIVTLFWHLRQHHEHLTSDKNFLWHLFSKKLRTIVHHLLGDVIRFSCHLLIVAIVRNAEVIARHPSTGILHAVRGADFLAQLRLKNVTAAVNEGFILWLVVRSVDFVLRGSSCLLRRLQHRHCQLIT